MKTAGELLAESLKNKTPLDPNAIQSALQAATPPGIRVSVAGAQSWETCLIQDDDRAVGGRSITCTVCGLTSFNPNDVAHKYCANCHQFHEIMKLERQVAAAKLNFPC